MPVNQLGKRFRAIREAYKHRLEDLATELGCSKNTLSNIELGKVKSSADFLIRFASFYEESIDFIVFASDSEFEAEMDKYRTIVLDEDGVPVIPVAG